jgi:hypothetical protein
MRLIASIAEVSPPVKIAKVSQGLRNRGILDG